MPEEKTPRMNDAIARSTWATLRASSRMHKGIARSAKLAGDVPLNRYHHGFEEGLLKAMRVIKEKFGVEE